MRRVEHQIRDVRRALALISGAYLAVGTLGTWVAMRDGLAGRPFGWDLGISPVSGFVFGLGTALSAPLVLLLALAFANLLLWRNGRLARRATETIALLGAGFAVGMLAEPITWDPGTWSDWPTTAIVIANLVLPLMLVLLGLEHRASTLSPSRSGVGLEAHRR